MRQKSQFGQSQSVSHNLTFCAIVMALFHKFDLCNNYDFLNFDCHNV